MNLEKSPCFIYIEERDAEIKADLRANDKETIILQKTNMSGGAETSNGLDQTDISFDVRPSLTEISYSVAQTFR